MLTRTLLGGGRPAFHQLRGTNESCRHLHYLRLCQQSCASGLVSNHFRESFSPRLRDPPDRRTFHAGPCAIRLVHLCWVVNVCCNGCRGGVLQAYRCPTFEASQTIFGPEGPDASFICCIRLTLLNACEVEALRSAGFEKEPGPARCRSSPSNDAKAFAVTAKHLRGVLNGYTTTIEQDAASLQAEPLSPDRRSVVELRYYEKRTWRAASSSPSRTASA